MSAPNAAPEGGAQTIRPQFYIFGDADRETRVFVPAEEIADLAARSRALTTTLERFSAVDDRGDGLLRGEMIRAARVLADRMRAVLG